MRAITVKPGEKNSARLQDVPEPPISEGSVLVRALALGVCGTDREILEGLYGAAPAGEERLILGHESLGSVLEAPPESGLQPGDLVVGIVRRPDPIPCRACAAGEWDMCLNGLFTERGISGRHGYAAQRFRLEPEFAVKVDTSLGMTAVLMEPTSIVAKAWDHADRIAARAQSLRAANVLVTGAGPIGLLAALMGLQRGLDVHVLDRNREGAKPKLATALGVAYHTDVSGLSDKQFDIVMECTAASALVVEAIRRCAPSGMVCLLGVSSAGKKTEFDIGGFNRKLVLNNEVVFGSVNANLSHYRAAERALLGAKRSWLEGLITRRVTLERWEEALQYRHEDIKVIIDFQAS